MIDGELSEDRLAWLEAGARVAVRERELRAQTHGREILELVGALRNARADARAMACALGELVALKAIHDGPADARTLDAYAERKPVAWAKARELVLYADARGLLGP